MGASASLYLGARARSRGSATWSFIASRRAAVRPPNLSATWWRPRDGAITALALVALIGDVTRFPSPRHLVGYLA